MKRISFFGAAALICVACGSSSDDGGSGGSAGSSTGGAAGSSTGGAAGSSTGGAAGSSTGGAAGSSTGGAAGSSTGGAAGAGGAAGGSGGVPGDAGVCQPLMEAMQKSLEAATACNPAVSSVQCDGSATSPDSCGCPVLLNEKTPDKVKAAQAAYKAWTDAGCGPFPCGKACFAGTTGTCNPGTSTCQWSIK